MSLSEVEVKELVEDFLAKQDLKGHRYEFVKVNFDDKYPDEYGAVFNVYTSDDSLIDGPAVFIVDKNSKEVSVL
jgi:hypothetical protein